MDNFDPADLDAARWELLVLRVRIIGADPADLDAGTCDDCFRVGWTLPYARLRLCERCWEARARVRAAVAG